MLRAPFGAQHSADPFGDWPAWRKQMGLGPHRGKDWNLLNIGTPIPASGPGRVVWRTRLTDAQAERTALGHQIQVAYPLGDGREIRLGYSHLHRSPSLEVGATVSLGNTVGLLGNSGSATTGAHLHQTASWSTGDPGSIPVIDPMQFFGSSSVAGGGATPLNDPKEDNMRIIQYRTGLKTAKGNALDEAVFAISPSGIRYFNGDVFYAGGAQMASVYGGIQMGIGDAAFSRILDANGITWDQMETARDTGVFQRVG